MTDVLRIEAVIKVKGKAGFEALLKQVVYQPNTPDPNHTAWDQGLITQVGAYGDIRPYLDLLNLVEDSMTDVMFLRGKDPDLQSRFIASVDHLVEIKNRFIANAEILKKDLEGKDGNGNHSP